MLTVGFCSPIESTQKDDTFHSHQPGWTKDVNGIAKDSRWVPNGWSTETGVAVQVLSNDPDLLRRCSGEGGVVEIKLEKFAGWN